mgnify:CR=1 FL=1|tara:strand:+ start:1482 stop:2684 length:1203 start_codon:yes stop_codon:yes gene_type:complete
MSNANSSEILYISIDGIMEPLGYSQVYKYLEKLSVNHKISLITFEKKNDLSKIKAVRALEKKCLENGIDWHRLRYMSGWLGLGQMLNIAKLYILPIYILMFQKVKVIHIRSYMPGISMPLLSMIFNFKLIFDIRGFWADEKKDRLNWNPSSYKYKFFKYLEKYLMKRGDVIITLTHASKEIILKNFYKKNFHLEVIPTCVDNTEFFMHSHIKDPERLTIGYLGSTDTAYDFKKFSSLITQIQKNYIGNIDLKIYSNKQSSYISNLLNDCGVKDVSLDAQFIDRQELPEKISKFDFLGFYLKENFSVQASMPTKIAEVLACGIPVVCNAFNSDIKNLITDNDVGLIYNFSDTLSKESLKNLLALIKHENTPEKCINISQKYFSLDKGALKIEKIYMKLLAK